MKNLKGKYIKLSAMLSIGLFRSYINKVPLNDKITIELHDFIKNLEFKSTKEYFDTLFNYIENNKNRTVHLKFMENVFVGMLKTAKSQIEMISKEIEKLETDLEKPEDLYHKKLEMLKSGYYCAKEELDELLNHFTTIEEFEICNEIVHIKKRYYES